jgi:23S rRNA pseudouridine1911/1915/1917 synthase
MNAHSRQPVVIHEDNHLIVIDKPPRLPTMGVAADQPSLVDWTKEWIRKKYHKPGNVYLGVVSRLDSFTSGLIVFARTSKAAARLTRQFQSGEVEKQYTAILEGRSPQPAGQLTDWVCKDDARRRMVVCGPDSPGARRAVLSYEVVGCDGRQTLVRIRLLTGRKHQIRVQFSSRGTPVLGDRKYDGRLRFADGIALHSSRLAFQHPIRRDKMSFRIEPPDYWNLARFRGK